MEVHDTVSEVLKKKAQGIWSIAPGATVFRAVEVMADKHVGALLVMIGDALVGVVSERDYARKVILLGKSSRTTLVSDIMTRDVISIGPGHTVDACMHLMTDRRVRHLPVVENEKVIGVVSIGDLVNWIMSAQNQTIERLQQYLAGQ